MRPAVELDLPLSVDRTAATPLHDQLATALRGAIRERVLPPGSRLPSTRLLAQRLGVARGTVLRAYEQLSGEGYLESDHGSGSYVRSHIRPVASTSTARSSPPAEEELEAGVVDLRPGRPDTSRLADPAWVRAWRDAARDVPPEAPHPQGLPLLRHQVAAHLQTARGLVVDPADIVITTGTSDGLALVAHLLGAGASVAVEDPGYPQARVVLDRLGCTVVPVPVDADGLQVHQLAQLPAAPQAVMVTPSHQFPLGGVLPVDRRLELLDWAARTRSFVVEDDYDSEFRFESSPLPALATLDGGQRVVHLGTFSKVVSPWLRLGYLVAPPPLTAALRHLRSDLGSFPSGVVQQAVGRYLAGGGLRQHIARARRDYRHRHQHLVALLAHHRSLRLHGTGAGLHAVIGLPAHVSASTAVGRLRAQGILLADLEEFDVVTRHQSPRPAVVMGYGHATLVDLQRAVGALADCCDAPG